MKSIVYKGKEKDGAPLPKNETVISDHIVKLGSGLKKNQVWDTLFLALCHPIIQFLFGDAYVKGKMDMKAMIDLAIEVAVKSHENQDRGKEYPLRTLFTPPIERILGNS